MTEGRYLPRIIVGVVVTVTLVFLWHRFDNDMDLDRGPVRTTTTQPRSVP